MLRHIFKMISFSVLFALSLSQVPNWDCDGDGVLDNYNIYANNGSISGTIIGENDVNLVSEEDLFASFVGDEQRGAARAVQVPFGPNAGLYYFPIMIYSNEASGETLSFKFYDSETNLLYDISETYEFISDMAHGDIMSLEIFFTTSWLQK